MSQPDTSTLIAPDVILMILGASGGHGSPTDRIDGITRLEKLLYLVRRETSVPNSVDEYFTFKPYNYGPYSQGVYEAVELLEEAGLIHEDRVLEGHTLDEMEEAYATASDREGVERRFSLTDAGRAVAELLRRRHPSVAKDLADVRAEYAAMPLRQLIRYVYSKYPESAVKSTIRDDVLG